MLPFRVRVSAVSLFAFFGLLILALLAGACLLFRLLPEGESPAVRVEGALALGLPAGLVLFAMPGWVLTALFRVSIPSVLVPLGLVVSVVVILLGARPLLAARGAGWKALIPLAILVAGFVFYLWFRYTNGDIRQTEKPMDFAILSSLMTAKSLPLLDPWSAGDRFPYYHFGVLVLALPARLSGLAPEYAYNFLIALLAGMSAAGAYGAVRLRGGGRAAALIAAALLPLAGTFDGFRQLASGKPLGEIDLWVSSRRVTDTITEWPLFTLWLGDLHPHVVSFPLFLAWIGLAGLTVGIAGIVLEGLMLAALLSANPWDFPAAMLIFGAALLVTRGVKDSFLRGLSTGVPTAIFALPFLLAPRPEFQGLRLAAKGTTSPEAFLHLGAFVVIPALAVGIALCRSREKPDEALLAATVFPALAILVMIASKKPVLGLAVGFVAAVLYLLPRLSGALRAGFLFSAATVTLVAIPEAVVVRDPYGEQFHRMNTVFKCYSTGALIFWVSCALLLPLVLGMRRLGWLTRGILLAALAGTLAHPLSIGRSRWRGSGGTLDGLAWMSREFPGDRKAIDWLRKNAPADAVIAEAVGGAYTDHTRIGSSSGRPIVMGWPNHEGLWRGAAGQPSVDARASDVKTLFTSRDEAEVKAIVLRRKIRYIVVGPLEKKEYGEEPLPLRSLFRKVLDEDGTALFEVPG
ncbi:MAG: hypothetical protein DIJKHBIC_01887 [Thermoanaerobaculia bacterium]|nr:hypothetical protein [Thermoanaerobaculia bacterium]